MKPFVLTSIWMFIAVYAYGQSADTLNIKALKSRFTGWTLTEVAPGGRIDAIRQTADGMVVCAGRGINKGKLWVSYDYGVRWQLLAQPVNVDITCIAETGRKEEFYFLTGTAEVWGTADGGKSWQRLHRLLPQNRNRQRYAASYALMYTKDGTLLATDTDSDGGHIYRSTDKGKTWTDAGAVSHDALYRFERTGNGIVVNGWEGIVYKSTDDGITWNRIQQLADTALFATEYLGMSVMLQADQAGTVYRSPNLGYEWDSVATLNGAADDFVNIGYGAAYYGTYTGDKNVYLTTDYGRRWYNLGPLPSVAGDWLDHGVRLETADSVITLSGTNKGYIVRNTFSKTALSDFLDYFHGDSRQISPERNFLNTDAIEGHLIDTDALNEPEDIVINNGFAYIPCRDGNNVAVIDYRNPSQPVLACNLGDKDILDAFSVAISGDYLYVLSMTNHTVSVFRVTDPYRPVKITALTVGGKGGYLPHYRSDYTRLRKIIIAEGYAYITHSSESKVYILDIRDPQKPKIISSFHTGDGAFAALVHKDVLYLAGYGPGSSVITVDISDKMKPVITARVYDPVELKGTCALAIRDNRLYVTAYNAGTVWSLDITDPLNPAVMEKIRDKDMRGPGRIAFHGDLGFVLNSINSSVALLDVGEDKMRLKGFLQHPLLKRVYGIAIDNDRLLLAGREAKSFVVIDLKKITQ
ncbi:hypothetical protein GCM10023091_28370 [Ravibacter arvi]|uniref:Sortilin N-terminal domain-containing protein n=1 Tax=Ravibacter arvi TaxID=2051041 RepID=A0ABP8M0U7_9BACT